MDLRRLANVAFAYFSRNMTAESLVDWVEELREPFDDELDQQARRKLEYRRKAREIGAASGQAALMDAFKVAGV
jgi:uncharacterized protein YeeX (DUF496 family)